MSQLTTHILDTTHGRPASDVTVVLYAQQGNEWREVVRSKTNADGRITDWLDKNKILTAGMYKLKFETGPYFWLLSIPTFYPFVEVVFAITDASHYHVPLLLNPFGYSTYRGS